MEVEAYGRPSKGEVRERNRPRVDDVLASFDVEVEGVPRILKGFDASAGAATHVERVDARKRPSRDEDAERRLTPYVTKKSDFRTLDVTYGEAEGAVAPQFVEIVAHPDAPLFAATRSDKEVEETFAEAMRLGEGIGDYTTDPRDLDEDDLELLREASLVNLYFFLRYVAGYANAYNELIPTLHGEMCNFAQLSLRPGARCAAFLPRFSFKSTVFSHGLDAWRLVRNPNERQGVFGGLQERADDFMHCVQRVFDANDLVALLWPSSKPKSKRDGTWNEKVLRMPSRTRSFPEPSCRAHTAGGTTAGIHVDHGNVDDIVSDAELTSTKDASSEMIRRRDWLPYALATILMSQTQSTVMAVGTRYSIDDPWESVMRHAKTHYGDWSAVSKFYEVDENGGWDVYYRTCLDDEGVSIFPSKYTKETLEALAKEDFWTYITQFVNNPHAVEKIEFSGHDVGHAQLGRGKDGELVVVFDGEEHDLHEADVVLAGDPASSDKRVSAKTSRSSAVVSARFAIRMPGSKRPRRVVVFLDIKAGYLSPALYFDTLFALHRRFAEYVRASYMETAGPFKFLLKFLREEEARRKTYINVQGIQPLGDKLATIRSAYEPLLRDGDLYVVDDVREELMWELSVFPSMSLDVLDAGKIAIAKHVEPEGVETSEYDEDDEEREEIEYAFARRSRR